MGYWTNTTYVNHGDVQAVATAVEGLCAAEGMQRVASPPERARLLVEPMQYDVAVNNDLWGLALFPGADAWTVIQTAPLELLGERAAGASHMRLADLSRSLAVPAFQLNVYDSTETVLVEVSHQGEVFASGFSTSGPGDALDWNGERLSEEWIDAQFRLLPFQGVIETATLGDERAQMIAQHFGGRNHTYCDNLVSVDTLISHKPFTAPGGLSLYFRWPGRSRQRYQSCSSWDEYRAATLEPRQRTH
jgi:hypothetical protein